MRDPNEWLAAAIYDAVRRMLPRIFFKAWGQEIELDLWDRIPEKLRDAFRGFAIVLVETINHEEIRHALAKGEAECEQEEETKDNG